MGFCIARCLVPRSLKTVSRRSPSRCVSLDSQSYTPQRHARSPSPRTLKIVLANPPEATRKLPVLADSWYTDPALSWLAQIHTDSQPPRSGLEQLSSGFVLQALSSSVLRAEQRVKKIVLWQPHLKITRWNTGRQQGISQEHVLREFSSS